MSVLSPFEDARAALGLAAGEEDAAAIKRAYRRALAAHPPDVDPDGFRRIREAYELLRDPWERAQERLLHQLPLAPPPGPPAEVPRPARGATAVTLLRLAAMAADTEAWTKEAPAKPPRARRKKEPT